MRIVSIHVLHPPKIFWPFYHIGKRFVKQKILERVHFHADYESLHKFFNKERLPDFLGGDLSEEEATETHVFKQILKEDIPYEGTREAHINYLLVLLNNLNHILRLDYF